MGWSRPKVTTYWPSCISNVTCSAHAHRVVLASLLQGAESFARTLPFQRIDHPCDQGLWYCMHHLKAVAVCPGAKIIKFSVHGRLWKNINCGNNPAWHASPACMIKREGPLRKGVFQVGLLAGKSGPVMTPTQSLLLWSQRGQCCNGFGQRYNDSLFLLSDLFLLMHLAFCVCNGFPRKGREAVVETRLMTYRRT